MAKLAMKTGLASSMQQIDDMCVAKAFFLPPGLTGETSWKTASLREACLIVSTRAFLHLLPETRMEYLMDLCYIDYWRNLELNARSSP